MIDHTPISNAVAGSPQKTQTLLYDESKHVRICDIIGVRWLEDASVKVLEWKFYRREVVRLVLGLGAVYRPAHVASHLLGKYFELFRSMVAPSKV